MAYYTGGGGGGAPGSSYNAIQERYEMMYRQEQAMQNQWNASMVLSSGTAGWNTLALPGQQQCKPFEKIEDLSKNKRIRILSVLREVFDEHKLQIRIKLMSSGIKWFLICLGLAILFNFSGLLNLFAIIVRR